MCILVWTNHEILWHCLFNWNDLFGSEPIFCGKQKKDPWLTNNVLLQSSIRGCFEVSLTLLWILERKELLDHLPRKKMKQDQCLNILFCYLCLVTCYYLYRKRNTCHMQNTVLRQSSLRFIHGHKWSRETVSSRLSCQQIFNPFAIRPYNE